MMQKKVLIVDDEEDVLRVVGRRLSDAGYAVIQASNGKEAILLAKKQQPNLIILDIIMPEMDGGEAAQILKSDPLTKNIPILFLTCLLTKEEEKTEKIIAGSYFIAKPYNPEELMREVKRQLG